MEENQNWNLFDFESDFETVQKHSDTSELLEIPTHLTLQGKYSAQHTVPSVESTLKIKGMISQEKDFQNYRLP